MGEVIIRCKDLVANAWGNVLCFTKHKIVYPLNKNGRLPITDLNGKSFSLNPRNIKEIYIGKGELGLTFYVKYETKNAEFYKKNFTTVDKVPENARKVLFELRDDEIVKWIIDAPPDDVFPIEGKALVIFTTNDWYKRVEICKKIQEQLKRFDFKFHESIQLAELSENEYYYVAELVHIVHPKIFIYYRHGYGELKLLTVYMQFWNPECLARELVPTKLLESILETLKEL